MTVADLEIVNIERESGGSEEEREKAVVAGGLRHTRTASNTFPDSIVVLGGEDGGSPREGAAVEAFVNDDLGNVDGVVIGEFDGAAGFENGCAPKINASVDEVGLISLPDEIGLGDVLDLVIDDKSGWFGSGGGVEGGNELVVAGGAAGALGERDGNAASGFGGGESAVWSGAARGVGLQEGQILEVGFKVGEGNAFDEKIEAFDMGPFFGDGDKALGLRRLVWSIGMFVEGVTFGDGHATELDSVVFLDKAGGAANESTRLVAAGAVRI